MGKVYRVNAYYADTGNFYENFDFDTADEALDLCQYINSRDDLYAIVMEADEDV